MADNLTDQAEMSSFAAAELRQFQRLRDRLVELDVDPEAARWRRSSTPSTASMPPRRPAIGWRASSSSTSVTASRDDFYVEMAEFVDPDTAELIRSVFADRGQADFVVTTVREAIAADRNAGRSRSGVAVLWARR